MQKALFKLSFIGLLFLTTINTTTPSDQIEKINIIDQTSEQSDLPSANDIPFFDLSINEIWKTKLKPVLQNPQFYMDCFVLFGSLLSMKQLKEVMHKAYQITYSNNIFHRIALFDNLKLEVLCAFNFIYLCGLFALGDIFFTHVLKI